MHERIRLNFVRLNKMYMYKIFLMTHELYRMHLIIWRVRSTNDKMIQVFVKKMLVIFLNKSRWINKLLLFLQPDTVSNFTKKHTSIPRSPIFNRVATPPPPPPPHQFMRQSTIISLCFFFLRNIFHPISSIDFDLKSHILLPIFF